MSEYAKKYYGVPADLNRLVTYRGRLGIIAKDGGSYVAVNFEDEKAGSWSNIHPKDPDLVYLEDFGTVRKMTRSQLRYREWERSDSGLDFGEWLKGR